MSANGRVDSAAGFTALRRSVTGWLALAAIAFGGGLATAEEALEASVKAAYLYKFLTYVDWPAPAFASAEAPQVIGVLGADDVLAELQRMVVGRTVNGHPLVATRVAPGDSIDLLHVLYIGRSARSAAPLRAAAGRPILTITDAPTGLAEGSALNFVLVQGRVRFEASLLAAERAGLKLSARLLAVAERVITP
ncbi:MAG: YfiR family protein [Burkholderiales bacterium]|nr:YfiR family protein [Burkholderiales bacterium]